MIPAMPKFSRTSFEMEREQASCSLDISADDCSPAVTLSTPAAAVSATEHLTFAFINAGNCSTSKSFDSPRPRHSDRSITTTPLHAPLHLQRIPVEIMNVDRSLNEQARSLAVLSAGSDPDDIHSRLLLRIEEKFERQLVTRVLAGLGLARQGLTLGELILLGRRSERRVLSLLEFIRDHITARDGAYELLQPSLREAVLQRYASAARRKGLHLELARCFASEKPSRRQLLEEPWHLLQGEAWEHLRDFLTRIPVLTGFDDANALDLLQYYWTRLDGHADPGSEYQKSIQRHILTHHDGRSLYRIYEIVIDLLREMNRPDDVATWIRWLHRHRSERTWSYTADSSDVVITPVYLNTHKTSNAKAHLLID